MRIYGDKVMKDTIENVLIIDDDNWNYRIISRYLAKYNIKTEFSDKGYSGLATAVNKSPDIIFLDIILPDVRGTTILKILKMINITKNIPVMILSGNIDIDTIRLAKKYGATEFISKPYKEITIVEKLQKMYPKDPIFDLVLI